MPSWWCFGRRKKVADLSQPPVEPKYDPSATGPVEFPASLAMRIFTPFFFIFFFVSRVGTSWLWIYQTQHFGDYSERSSGIGFFYMWSGFATWPWWLIYPYCQPIILSERYGWRRLLWSKNAPVLGLMILDTVICCTLGPYGLSLGFDVVIPCILGICLGIFNIVAFLLFTNYECMNHMPLQDSEKYHFQYRVEPIEMSISSPISVSESSAFRIVLRNCSRHIIPENSSSTDLCIQRTAESVFLFKAVWYTCEFTFSVDFPWQPGEKITLIPETHKMEGPRVIVIPGLRSFGLDRKNIIETILYPGKKSQRFNVMTRYWHVYERK